MCTGGSSSPPPQDTASQEKYAELMRWMEEDWEQRFKPIEEGLIDEVMNKDQKIAENVQDAQTAAQLSYDATVGMSERNMARYGTEMDEDQLAAQERTNNIASQGAEISAMNMARDASVARYDQLQQNMMALGRGVQGQAISGMGSAANMEANRNIQNQQIYGQNQSNMWGTIGTIGGMAATGLIMSDEKKKKNIRPASARKALKDVESVELKHFDYKPGQSGGRVEQGHIGGMAGDMPTRMTTPDQLGVDLGDSVMTLVGATQALSKRLDKLEKRRA